MANQRRRGKPRERRGSVWTQAKADPSRLEEHKLRLGITDGSLTEVLQGDLKDGDLVVTSSSDTERKAPAAGGPGSKSRPRFF